MSRSMSGLDHRSGSKTTSSPSARRLITVLVATWALTTGTSRPAAAAAQQGPFNTGDGATASPGIDASGDWGYRTPHASAAPAEGGSSGETRVAGAVILDDYLAGRIQRLEQRSAQFRAAMVRARNSRIPVVIGTPPQVSHFVASHLSLGQQVARGYLAEFIVQRSAPESPKIDMIVIRIGLDELRRVPWWRRLGGEERLQRWLDVTTDAILIHEIWGHLVPVLEAGDYTGNCPDPRSGEAAVDSCVMKRENALRQELGLKPRTRYAIEVR